MNFIDYNFSLDIHAAYAQTSLTVMKKDSKRRLCINLVEKGRPYEISEECYAVFAAKKPDGKYIYNNCVIENNKIFYELTEQTTIAVGEMPCEIKLYGADDALISSPRFKIIVNKPVFDDEDENEIESSNEVTALTSLISQATSIVSEIETKLENGEFNGKGLTILGYYETLSELKAAVVSPEIGDVYGIGPSAPYNIYVWTINGWVDNGQIQGPAGETGLQGPQGPQGPQGNPGKDGLTTSVNGVQQVNGNVTLTASNVGADPSGTAANAVSSHNGDSSAHSELFVKKVDKPVVVNSTGEITVTVAENTEYKFSDVSSLTMTGAFVKAHGFVIFGSSAPSVSVTGFAKSGGDDVAGAKASEIWEFSTDTGYIIWKNWSA